MQQQSSQPAVELKIDPTPVSNSSAELVEHIAPAGASASPPQTGATAPAPAHAKREFHLSGESTKLQAKVVRALSREVVGDRKTACVQFFINRIFKVSDVQQSCHLDIYVKINWKSDNWVGRTDDEFQADETHLEKDWWKPGVEITNAIEMEKETDEEEAYWLEFPEQGIIAYTQRYIGTLHAPMHLKDFPFDHQVIPINFESFHWKDVDLKLVRLPSHGHQEAGSEGGYITMSDDVELVEWDVESIDVEERTKYYRFEDRSYSQIAVAVRLRRKWGFYLLKVILILVLIVMMSWSVCAMDPSTLPDRTAVTVTLFLAAVAFNFVIGAQLPKVAYNTKLDYYLLAVYLLVTVSVLENVLSYQFFARLGTNGEPGLAYSFDKWSAVALAGTFVIYNIYFFAAAVWREVTVRLDGNKSATRTSSMAILASDPDLL